MNPLCPKHYFQFQIHETQLYANLNSRNMEEGSTEESEDFSVLPAEEGQIKYICKIAMMAGTKRKEALGLMKKLIGITNETESYILESLNRMARPDPNPAVFNPYAAKKKGRPPGDGKMLQAMVLDVQ